MNLIVYKKALESVINSIKKAVDEFGVKYKLVEDIIDQDLETSELVIVVGGDREVLQTFHKIGKAKLPVLGVNDSNESSFLTEISIKNFQEALKKLIDGEYNIEEATRLNVIVDDKELPPALNEVAVFSSKSATLMEYLLTVDKEVIWRDYSDGVIVSTPTGSTAYSMSAGGPMVLHDAEAFAIVSVNSLDVTRRPLIVSDKSHIKIGEISSSHGCEVIVDGTYRAKVRERVEAFKFPEPARFVRPSESSKAMDKMVKKVRLAEELLKMPPSAKLILKTLEYEGPLTQRDLAKKTMLPDRTTRLALALLIERGLVKRRSTLRDARQKVYYIT
ncbi:MAG: NAD(+)/NADH kinase [archaeon]|nr:NAD(+)/NADH kinase [archaeon]MCP8314063.1 NAD(+)/NADH kinase [archaeon]MCP8315907.1 NAD(+)/NADH kinase [archaeon]MCP8320602.1 NAD(+)/NADH kinase [archaeon]